MRITIFFLGMIALMVFTIMEACTHGVVQPVVTNTTNGNSNQNGNSNEIPCDPDSVYFQNDILPLLQSSCAISGCHDVSSHKDGVILVDYTSIMSTADVDPGKSSKSDLYKVLIETDPDKIMPQPPMSALSSTQIEMIQKWIDQGAKNNFCMSCDTSGVIQFSTSVQPILQSNCISCHSSTNQSGGIDLSNFIGVSSVVNNGKLLGSILHQNGYSAMPQGGVSLSDCSITKIQKWIANGAQND